MGSSIWIYSKEVNIIKTDDKKALHLQTALQMCKLDLMAIIIVAFKNFLSKRTLEKKKKSSPPLMVEVQYTLIQQIHSDIGLLWF